MENVFENVLINIKTELSGEDFPIEMALTGNLKVNGDSFEVEYRESEITGMGRTLTKVVCADDEVILERNGEFKAKLIFHKGEIKIGYYQTPYGEMDMMTDTEELEYGKNDKGYFLNLVYSMDINGQRQGRTSMKMQVKVRQIS